MKIQNINAVPLSVARFVVQELEIENGDPKEVEKVYNLVLDMNAMALAREKTGLDFMNPESWQNLHGANLRTLCWTAFKRFYPDVSEEKVGSMIPASFEFQVWSMLMELAFPGSLERIRKHAEEAKKEGHKAGESQPVAEEKTA